MLLQSLSQQESQRVDLPGETLLRSISGTRIRGASAPHAQVRDLHRDGQPRATSAPGWAIGWAVSTPIHVSSRVSNCG